MQNNIRAALHSFADTAPKHGYLTILVMRYGNTEQRAGETEIMVHAEARRRFLQKLCAFAPLREPKIL
jgi:hypothetical protein